jgi:hypothetical protein
MKEEDKQLRNTLIGVFVPFFLGICVAIAVQWISMDRRISLIEQQQQTDHELILQHNSDMSEINANIAEIKNKVIQLTDLKADKQFKQ